MVNWIIKNKKLIILLTLIFAVTLGYALYFRITPRVDARAYDGIAWNLVERQVYKEQITESFAKDKSIQRAGPAYEYMVAGTFFLFGHRYLPVWILQAALHAFTAFLIYLIMKKIFKEEQGESAAFLAAGIFGFHPDLVEISAMLMTETLFLFIIVAIIYLFIKIYENANTRRYSLAMGASMGLGIMARPTVLFFLPVFFVLYALRKKYFNFILLLLTAIILLAHWAARNYKIYHQFITTTLIGEYNLWVGNTLNSDGGQIGGGFNPFDDYIEKNNYYTVRQAASDSFRNFLIQHPGTFVELTAIRFVRYFSLLRPMGFWLYQSGLSQKIFVAFSAVAIVLLFISGLSGALKLWRRNALFKYLIILAATSPLPLLITVVQSRYRFPLYPFLAIFGGYFIAQAIKNRGWWKEKTFIVAVVFLGLVSAIELYLNLN